MLEFTRPYIPELVGWFRDFGVGAANYDANGHYARIQPIFNAFQLNDCPAGPACSRRCRSPSASTACRPASLKRCPGAASQPPGRRLGAVHRRRPRQPRLRPEPGARPAHDAQARRRSSSCSRSSSLAVVLIARARATSGRYQVRAIFDNAGFVIPGEDVKVAGVKVGKIDSLDVTPDFKAAVVLDITEPGYQDFRNDASCIVRPQNADRRALRRVQADPAARRRRPPAAADAEADRARAGRGPVPAAGRATPCRRSTST